MTKIQGKLTSGSGQHSGTDDKALWRIFFSQLSVWLNVGASLLL
jgi:hypothetical protein